MDYIILKNIEKSFRNKKKAIREMFELFPEKQFKLKYSSQNPYDKFEVSGVSIEEFAKVATRVYVSHKELFDFGKPKIIQENYSIYSFDYLTISMSLDIKYENYGMKHGSVMYNDELNISVVTPEKEFKTIDSIVLEQESNYKGYGLKYWKRDYDKIKKLLNKNPNKELIKEYKEKVIEADDEVIRWEKEFKEIKKIKIFSK